MKGFKGIKGKWAAETSGGKGSWIGNENGWAALSCGNTHEESEANALLISKAPELLEMLQKFVIATYTGCSKDELNKLRSEAEQLIQSATDLTQEG